MKNQSLQEIMNEMARQPGSVVRLLSTYRERLKTDNDAFIAIDAILADLNKQHLDARSRYQKLRQKHGPDDPMVDVASDIVDSTQCAFETRLIEVRDDKSMQRAALRHIHKQRQEAEEERIRNAALFRARMHAFNKSERQRRKDKKEMDENMSLAIFLLWMLYFILQRAQIDALKLGQDFTFACTPQRRVSGSQT